MSILYEMEVLCDECQTSFRMSLGSRPDDKRAIKRAQERGWLRKKIGRSVRDFCPDCRPMFEEPMKGDVGGDDYA